MRRLLFFDGFAGTAVGLGMLAFAAPLAELCGYSLAFTRGLAAANFGYGCAALLIAQRFPASLGAAPYMIAANAAWPLVSAVLIALVWRSASGLGVAYLAAEGLFVGILAAIEWRTLARLRQGAAAA